MAMRKRILCFLCCLLSTAILAGCWNYVGLNEIEIVAGFAVDIDEQTGQYLVTYETVDVATNVKETGPISKIIQAEGRTLFDTARNAKMREQHKLYFGDTLVLIIGQEVLKKEDLEGILSWFLHDAEIRETMYIAISAEEYAYDIFVKVKENKSLASFVLHDIFRRDKEVTSSAHDVLLYQAYNMLKTEGKSLSLPLVHLVQNGDKMLNELFGTAVFKGQRMVGSLNPEESKYLLFVLDEVKGGVITLPMNDDERYDITLEISENHTKVSYENDNGEIIMNIETDTVVYLDESHQNIDMTDKTQIKALEVAAGEVIGQNIQKTIQKVQREYNSDIFGFGSTINKTNHALWEQISPEWDSLFPQLKVQIKSKVRIANTAFIRTKGK